MAEIEIHAGPEHAADPFGQRVGVAVGMIGILLSIVTITSHRAHTAAVVHKTEANDQWAFYQAKKIKEHTLEVGTTLLEVLGTDSVKAADATHRIELDRTRYAKEAEEIKTEAQAKDAEAVRDEDRALRFDLAEGFLELGLVLTSLYFLSHKRFFPALGITAALGGAIFGAIGFLN